MVGSARAPASPSFYLALPALSVFYAVYRLPSAVFLPAGISLLVLFSLILTLRLTARNGVFFSLACVFFGSIAGYGSAIRCRAEYADIWTLARIDSVTGIDVTFLADPAPAGPDNHYALCRAERAVCADGSSFSASGRFTVFVPSRIARVGLPGSASGGEGRPAFFSAGTRVTLSGSFIPRKSEGDVMSFRATGVVADSASWASSLDGMRAALRLSLMRSLYDWGDAGGFLLALLSGNRDYLDPDLASDFKNTGLSHILALSGMHLSLLSLVVVRFGKRIGGKRVATRLSLVAILLFVWFAGFSPSLSRALLMALMLMALKRLGYETDVLRVLALTAFAQLVWNPSDALSVAFMLSYGALGGILTFGAAMLDAIPARRRNAVIDSLCASVGAQLMTSPITAVAFGVLAPIGIFASCAASPLSSVFMVSGMALLAVSAALPPLAAACGTVLSALYEVTAASVRAFSSVPPLSITSPAGTMLSCVFPLATGLFLVKLDFSARKRRSVDDLFARL